MYLVSKKNSVGFRVIERSAVRGSVRLAISGTVIAIARPSGAIHAYSNARPVGLWEGVALRLEVDSRAEHNVNRVTVKAANSNIRSGWDRNSRVGV
jgi:hypothetical protein